MSIAETAWQFLRRAKFRKKIAKSKELERLRKTIASEFDVEFYRMRYPDIGDHIDPIAHYIAHGWREGRDPSGTFSTRGYLDCNPDVLGAAINPFYHYITYGRTERRRMTLVREGIDAESVRAAIKSNYDAAAKEEDRRAGALNIAPIGSRKSGDNIPHYGAAFHNVVERAWARTKPVGTGSSEYEVIRAGFDLAHYLMCNPDMARAARIDPIQHYIDHGTNERRDPSPDFSTRHYVKRYRDIKHSGVHPFYHWLTVGRPGGCVAQPFSDFDELCRMLGRAPAEVQEDLIERRRDLRERFEQGMLGEMVKKAAELEPLIAQAWPEAFMLKLLPFHSDEVVAQVVAMHRLHQQAEFRRAKAVVVIPHCRLSGATRIAGHLANALGQIYGPEELVILRTDLDIMQFAEWFPAGCRHVNLAAEKRPQGAQERLLVEFLRSLRPEAVFNVNSRLLWDTLRSYGKALSASMALYAYFFCNDKNFMGHWNGYPIQKFYRYFDILSGVMTDSHYLAEELRERYLVPSGQAHRIVTLETPVPAPPPLAPVPALVAGRRPQIFWSGRFDRQKRVDLVYALARRMPEADFRLWGEPVLDGGDYTKTPPANVILQGVYVDLAELPLEECDLWLYTSEWDGVPNILIEVAARGVPVVGSLAGGTGEILVDGLSCLVADIEDIGAYEGGMRAILDDPIAARRRARQLRDDVLSRRTTAAYRQTLERLLSLSVIQKRLSA